MIDKIITCYHTNITKRNVKENFKVQYQIVTSIVQRQWYSISIRIYTYKKYYTFKHRYTHSNKNKRKSNFENLHSTITSIKTKSQPNKFDFLFTYESVTQTRSLSPHENK